MLGGGQPSETLAPHLGHVSNFCASTYFVIELANEPLFQIDAGQ